VGRSDRGRRLAPLVIVAILLVSALSPPARAGYPTVPLQSDGRFITNLSAPVLAPGQSGSISFDLADPIGFDLVDAVVSLAVYAFNAYPGNATGTVPSDAVALAGAGPACCANATDLAYTSSPATVVPGAPVPLTIPVWTSGSAPSGDYAIRLELTFTGNGTSYRLASRGEFTEAQWAAATSGPSGTSTLNLSTLGVSGVVPETAVLVRSNPFPVALDVILAAALVLAGAGGYYAFRRPRKSRSGAGGADDPSQAPTAFGNSRSSDGD
jgi:hypothetical protein